MHPEEKLMNLLFIGYIFFHLILSGFYPRDAMLERVFAFATATYVSVRLSVTNPNQYCIKTKKAIVMISSSSGSPTILII